MSITEVMTMEVMNVPMWEFVVRLAILTCAVVAFAKFVKRYGSSINEE